MDKALFAVSRRAAVSLAAVAALFLLTTGIVHASIVAIGDPVEGNSWSQKFRVEYDPDQVGFMAVKMVSSGSRFKNSVFHGFDDAGWSNVQTPKPSYGIATGSSSTRLEFNIKFEGSLLDSLQFIFVALSHDDSLKEEKWLNWRADEVDWEVGDTTAWSDEYWSADFCSDAIRAEASVSEVPEPASLAVWSLLGMSGIGATWWRRKRRKG